MAGPAFPSGPHVTGLRCLLCGRLHAPGTTGYVCDEHPDHPGEGILDVEYDYAAAKADFTPEAIAAGPAGMWRYRSLMPLPLDAAVPPLVTGMTPLYDAPELARRLGVARVLVKDESRQPTASLKDRASALAVSQARAMGMDTVATASTGNAAAALAGMAASMGLASVIFVPGSAPGAKLAQLLAFGARVFTVQGSYDQAFDMCLLACARRPWYNRNTAFNPFMTEGKKTAAYEIAEQAGWRVPDRVFTGVGDGCIIGGLHKGFADLHALGLAQTTPRLMGVQSEGSDYLFQAWRSAEDLLAKPAITADTVADSISAGLPRDRIKAMRAVTQTGGAFLRVEDEAILRAIPVLARTAGVFAEPAGAAALAGALAAAEQGLLRETETICLLATGSGLKDVPSAVRACADAGLEAVSVPPGDEGLQKALSANDSKSS